MELREKFAGKVRMEEVKEYQYLGFVISSVGDNKANIKSLKKKSIIPTKSAFQKLKVLHLQKYYFECGLMFKNIILRINLEHEVYMDRIHARKTAQHN